MCVCVCVCVCACVQLLDPSFHFLKVRLLKRDIWAYDVLAIISLSSNKIHFATFPKNNHIHEVICTIRGGDVNKGYGGIEKGWLSPGTLIKQIVILCIKMG